MSEIILVIVILGLLAYLGWRDFQDRKERNKLINTLVAKNAEELAHLTVAEKIEPEKSTESVADPESMPISDVSDQVFLNAINKQLEGEEERG